MQQYIIRKICRAHVLGKKKLKLLREDAVFGTIFFFLENSVKQSGRKMINKRLEKAKTISSNYEVQLDGEGNSIVT